MASLRELFTELTDAAPGAGADPVGLLRGHGFDLSAEEVAQALVNFAHTAPVAVAEHLQQYVAAHGPVPPEALGAVPVDPLAGLQLLAGAPAPTVDDLDADLTADLGDHRTDAAGAPGDSGPDPPPADPGPDLDVAFGAGSAGAPGGLPAATPPPDSADGELPTTGDPADGDPFSGPTPDLSSEPSWLGGEPAVPDEPGLDTDPDADFLG